MSQQNEIKPAFICCDAFQKTAKHFDWMSFNDDNGQNILVMPHILINNNYVDTERLRVNYCPTCGHNVRDIQLPRKQFNNFQI
jgi:hypothetical protein